MPASKAKIAANARYSAKTYARIATFVQKDEKPKLQAHAASRGESLNAFINRAINEAMRRDSEQPPPPPPPP